MSERARASRLGRSHMLSPHFWMTTGATVAMAGVMGLGLGSYVTSPRAPARPTSQIADIAPDQQDMAYTSYDAQKGPGAIHCTGCGPTLAERRWQAEMAGLDADATTDADPMIAQYQSDQPAEHRMPDTPPSNVHPSLAQIAQVVVGETTPPPVLVTRVRQEAAPPPAVVATAAASVLP